MGDKEDTSSAKKFFIVPIDPREYPGPYISPWIRLVIYVLMVFFTGTLYMGWNGFQTLLYKSGAFEELCIDVNDLSEVIVGNGSYVDCGLRKAAINNLYTIAFSTHMLSTVLTGFVFDHIGPKYLFLIAQFVNFVMWILISTMPKNKHILKLSFFFIGLTSESLIMPLMTLSYYFPSNQSLIISILGATRSLSFVVPILLSKIFEKDYFKPTDFYIIGVAYAFIANASSFITGTAILQKTFFKQSESPDNETTPTSSAETNDTASSIDKDDLEKSNEKSEVELYVKSKLSVVASMIRSAFNHPQFVEYIILVLVGSLYLASVEFVSKSQRELLLCSDGSSALNLFKYIHVLTFAPGPLMGFLIDKLGPPFVLVILHSCCFLYYFFVSFDYYFLKIMACVFYLFSCSMLVSHIYCYVSKRFDIRYFGELVGFCFFSGGLFVTLNIPLYNFMTDRTSALDTHNLKIVNRIFMGYMVAGFAMTLILLYFTTKKHKVPIHQLSDEK